MMERIALEGEGTVVHIKSMLGRHGVLCGNVAGMRMVVVARGSGWPRRLCRSCHLTGIAHGGASQVYANDLVRNSVTWLEAS